ncbi:MAG: AIR synthase related protein, partial [Candidatus Competibacterales bacterium]
MTIDDTGAITLAHGGGGKAMGDLVEGLFVAAFGQPHTTLEDQARLDLAPHLAPGGRLALTTDSFVVDPLFFPGGDIGKLAIWGTVNDLAVGGAKPLWLSAAFILEEGLAMATLKRVVASMAAAAAAAGGVVVSGVTKVVGRGRAAQLFITTSGVGVLPP